MTEQIGWSQLEHRDLRHEEMTDWPWSKRKLEEETKSLGGDLTEESVVGAGQKNESCSLSLLAHQQMNRNPFANSRRKGNKEEPKHCLLNRYHTTKRVDTFWLLAKGHRRNL